MLLTGPTGCGKTTLANSLVAAIDPEERLITIEDVLELVDHPAEPCPAAVPA